METDRLRAALAKASQALLHARNDRAWWEGELSSSALSTATAVTALALSERPESLQSSAPDGLLPNYQTPIAKGLQWLAQHQNEDGGWGDTTLSLSNISTTTLVWAAFGAAPHPKPVYDKTIAKAESWLSKTAGGIDPDQLAPAIIRRYGKDRTFSVPILTMCALAGRLGSGPGAWHHVIPLPFELAALPPSWFATLRLPVVSYALPALIAIGQVRFHRGPKGNPISRLIRSLTRQRTLRVLTSIQPENGGFLEATPLTSFVTMSLAGMGWGDHQVARKGRDFLLAAQRPDGCWPIDTNLATWLTTLSVNALESIQPSQATRIARWLLDQQYREIHAYTQAAPGGWAWTDLPGGVPDADDTAGAILALNCLKERLGAKDNATRQSINVANNHGANWLMDLQNRDGGIPTFCKGWGTLAFDLSSPDLTAHALRAWRSCQNQLEYPTRKRWIKARRRALEFLLSSQRDNGSWVPLWFGNQHDDKEENPVYGTSRVLLALADDLNRSSSSPHGPSMAKGMKRGWQWLLKVQNPDGSWGGNQGITGSVEETALAVEALAALVPSENQVEDSDHLEMKQVLDKGLAWLVGRVESDTWTEPSPIGFYFAKLWYYERLYPRIFTVAALKGPTSNRAP